MNSSVRSLLHVKQGGLAVIKSERKTDAIVAVFVPTAAAICLCDTTQFTRVAIAFT